MGKHWYFWEIISFHAAIDFGYSILVKYRKLSAALTNLHTETLLQYILKKRYAYFNTNNKFFRRDALCIIEMNYSELSLNFTLQNAMAYYYYSGIALIGCKFFITFLKKPISGCSCAPRLAL
jgi:hypothetical protein